MSLTGYVLRTLVLLKFRRAPSGLTARRVPRHQIFHESGPAKPLFPGFQPLSKVSLMEIMGYISKAFCHHQIIVTKLHHA
jgi:hypothetical protein